MSEFNRKDVDNLIAKMFKQAEEIADLLDEDHIDAMKESRSALINKMNVLLGRLRKVRRLAYAIKMQLEN